MHLIAKVCELTKNHIVTGPEVVVTIGGRIAPRFFKNGKENNSSTSNRQSRLESFQDFLIEVDMKPRMHLNSGNKHFFTK